MSTTVKADQTIGQQIQSCPQIRASIDTVIEQMRSRCDQITDVRGAIEGLSESYEAAMQRAGEVRGRGLLYPYIGSGAGNGALVELGDGSVKWDMICGIGVQFFGHSDMDLIRMAIEAGLDNTVKQGNLQSNEEAFAFTSTLLEHASKHSKLKHAFLSTSGAMANESALKVCFQKNAPASRVIAFKDCFMGRSVAMATIGDSAAGRVGLPAALPVDYMPFFDEVAAEKMGHDRFIDMSLMHLQQYIDRYPGQHACFIFELVQGEGGFNNSTRDYFVALMECCKANNIAVWVDEIQTFGRTETMFAFEGLDLGEYVDVACVGKMSQACATLFTEEYNPKPGLLSGTFTGETVSFRVGQRIIERLAQGDYYGDNGIIAQHHTAFREQVFALQAKHPKWFGEIKSVPGTPGTTNIVGGKGGMLRFTPFGGHKDPVVKACRMCFDEGVILFYCGHDPYHIRMLPPLGVMKLEDWPRVFERVEAGLARVAEEL